MTMIRSHFLGGSAVTWQVGEGSAVAWEVVEQRTLIGDDLPPITHLTRYDPKDSGPPLSPQGPGFCLTGVTSSHKYTTHREREALLAVSPPLGRAEASLATLIPITKSQDWWDLAQDERREIFEERSRHIAATMRFLPAVARRLYHARELGGPFDFLTWFEYAPYSQSAFDELLVQLRATEEWRYVVRECEIRVRRTTPQRL